jgi:Mg-chelatase subunit ChlD
VIDASTSMLETTPTGGTKLDAAIEAAGIFLAHLQLGSGDQAAIITFNVEAAVLQTLTDDRSLLDTALAAITTAEKTRIHLGMEKARHELASDRRNLDNTPVMIVLTDGRSNPDPVSLAVEQARLAKDEGVVVFTIGLGNEIDTDALQEMATTPEQFYHAPTADELADIYRQIAVEIPCPKEEFWGRR